LMCDVDDVISTGAEIRAWGPTAGIVFVAPKLDLDVMMASFGAGAGGYLLETVSGDALRDSLNLVIAGEKVFSSELASLLPMLASKFDSSGPCNLAPLESDLSRREIEILQCLTSGQSNKVIAKNLEIAEATVKVHVKRILRKAHALNRTQAALWGVATGVTSLPASRKVGS
jgi:two-component system nitrate/nitrite response regulator NarL